MKNKILLSMILIIFLGNIFNTWSNNISVHNPGSYASNNPFRFSSEYHDDGTAMIYYNYRYYSPKLGRWLSRDPLGENGGKNLYNFVHNNPVKNIDVLGLYTLDDAKKSLQDNQVQKSAQTVYLLDPTEQIYAPMEIYAYSDIQIFMEWYRLEKTRGSWWTVLPKCPQRICKLYGINTIMDETGLKRDKWLDPANATTITKLYHTDAAEIELRSITVSSHSNQCIYVKSADKKIFTLSKDIPIAGTVDWKAPGSQGSEFIDNLMNSGDGHQVHDVKPFNLAVRLGLVETYYEVRPSW